VAFIGALRFDFSVTMGDLPDRGDDVFVEEGA